jgi:hypothetical protein
MIELLAPAIVFLAGFFLVCLGATSLAAPGQARRFLLAFATSPGLHYLELALRFLVGGAFLAHAPAMRFSPAFTAFGWVLVLTTAMLVLIPWRWHQQFVQRSVPGALRFLPLLGLASLALGGFVVFALFGSAV